MTATKFVATVSHGVAAPPAAPTPPAPEYRGSVYLAGPISGLTFKGSTDWRIAVADGLHMHGIRSYSPLRGKDYLAKYGELTGHGREYAHESVLSSSRGVMTRDRFDATRCDVLFVNFLEARRVSIGTCMEIAWADAKRIPVVCAIEAEGNPHDHMMISEAIGFRVTSLQEALYITIAILADGKPQ